MKTLEQIIMDVAAHNWSSFVDKDKEAAAIAEAVRGWMREQNKGLRGVIFDILLEELPPQSVSHADADSCVDAILSVIPPEVMRTRTFKEAEEHMAYICKIEEENVNLRKRLPDPATLQTEMEKWQASRIRELEYELDLEVWQHAACLTIAETGEKWGPGVQPSAAMQAVYKLHNELAEEKSTRNLLTDENNALRVRLEQENKRLVMSGMESWNILSQKAKAYDALREKFPFLPGEEFWFCNGNRITKRKVDEISETHVLSGEYGLYQSECHPTADACRNAIKVEEYHEEITDSNSSRT